MDGNKGPLKLPIYICQLNMVDCLTCISFLLCRSLSNVDDERFHNFKEEGKGGFEEQIFELHVLLF